MSDTFTVGVEMYTIDCLHCHGIFAITQDAVDCYQKTHRRNRMLKKLIVSARGKNRNWPAN